MGIVDWIYGRPADPTSDWPEYRRQPPVLDLARGSFNGVRFREPLAVAQGLGRPDVFRWTRRQECELQYARGGFVVEFWDGLEYVGMLIAADETSSTEISDVEYCRPILRGVGPSDFVATAESNEPAIVAHFGEPQGREDDQDEIILTYEIGGYSVEFELTKADTLKRINVFPEPRDE